MNKIKILIFSIIILFILWIASWFGLFGYIGSSSQSSIPVSKVQNEVDIVTLIIDFGEGEGKVFEDQITQTTVFELLKKLSSKNNIEIIEETYDFGVLVKSIDGFENSNEKAWIYFVNGEAGGIAADKMEVVPGDTVEWKYIPPTTE